MNRTFAIGGVLFLIGFFTITKFQYKETVKGAGGFLMFVGLFLVWNGYVAEFNDQLSFAIFG